jgi:hypothetical protein
MAEIYQFDPNRKKKEPQKKKAEPKKKVDNKSLQVRHNKAHTYLAEINALHRHKFSYPSLAFRYPKGTHSIDVLHSHCFTNFGAIQKDNDKFPGIAFAKRVACERQEEILSFLNWRLRKYQEAKTLYGTDLIIVDIYIEMLNLMRNQFQELFSGRT